MATDEQHCPQCNKPFRPTRLWQVFCTAACRLRAWRKKKREGK